MDSEPYINCAFRKTSAGAQAIHARNTELCRIATVKQPHRLSALRAALKSSGLNGFIVPKADEFQNEYAPGGCGTGLPGSRASPARPADAVILEDKAALIVDSRYTLQAKAEVSEGLYAVELFPKTKVSTWLAANPAKGAVIGYDPALHTLAGMKPLLRRKPRGRASNCGPAGAIPWMASGRTAPPGSTRRSSCMRSASRAKAPAPKLARVQKAIQENGAAGLIVCAPDAVSWLFNIRGHDVVHTPVPLVRAYVPAVGKPVLFASLGHITPGKQGRHRELADVAIWPPSRRFCQA